MAIAQVEDKADRALSRRAMPDERFSPVLLARNEIARRESGEAPGRAAA
jgi:hypothetical protein